MQSAFYCHKFAGMKLKNRNVLITGGASGIGRIMGRIALEKGARTFIIWNINITSAGGMLSNPRMSVYAASKWGATGWSDSVRIELQDRKSNVHITTVAPYFIKTGMFEGVRSPIIPILKPEWVSKRIIKGIERNRSFCGIPFGFHFIRFWQAILPVRIFDWFFGELFGIYHAMDEFTGRRPHISHESKAS